jgi:hypothetical protein
MLTAVYHFEVSDLWVRSEVLGTRHAAIFAGHAITLILPADGRDFGLERDISGLSALGGYTLASATEDLLAAEVLIIRLEVEVDSNLKAPAEPVAEPEPSAQYPVANSGAAPEPSASPTQPTPPEQVARPDANTINEGIRIFRETVNIAREFAERYVALVRTELDQYWLGPSESRLRLTWLSQLIDRDGHTIQVGYSEAGPVQIHGTESALTGELHAVLVQKASEGAEPNLADKFLRDAEYTAFAASTPHLRQAVLLAAIACEIKVKAAITTLASPEQLPLVNLLLENPRDWTMAAAALFDKGLKAVSNISLRDEDRPLYNQIDLLFQDRNKIAHRGGVRVSHDVTLIKHITSAKLAFEWLDGILGQVSEGDLNTETRKIPGPGKLRD